MKQNKPIIEVKAQLIHVVKKYVILRKAYGILRKNQQKSYRLNKKQHILTQNIVIFAKKYSVKRKIIVRDHDHYTGIYRGAAHLICNLSQSTPIDIPVFFHDGTSYEFNFIITELAKEFKSEMRCIPLNTDKYMSFSIPIKKDVKKQKEQNELKKPKKKVITYNLKLIESAKNMSKA